MIHDKKELSDTEKLACLRAALKDATAEAVISGLAKSGETYMYGEAIDCLCQRYDRPRVVHQAYVNAIFSDTKRMCESSLLDISRKAPEGNGHPSLHTYCFSHFSILSQQ